MIEEQLKQFYTRYKLVIWPVIVGLCSVVIIALVIVPQLLSYFSLKQQGDELNNRLGLLQVKAKELQQIDPQVYNKNLNLALSALPPEKEVPQAVTILQTFISQSGMTLEAIKFASGQTTTINNNYQINITVLGDFNSLKKLLTNIRNSPRIYRVDMINAQSSRGGTSVEADITMTVFYEPLNNTIGAVDQPLPQLTDKDQHVLTDLSTKNQVVATNASVLTVPLGKSDPFN